MSTIHGFTDFKDLMQKLETNNVYLFIGNGPKKQYKDVPKVEASVRKTLADLGVR